jgi:alpha-L-fucosidase
MRSMFKLFVVILIFSGLLSVNCQQPAPKQTETRYKADWESLNSHQTPQWLKDGKFGIYTHWGIYSVPAMGPNATWYSHTFYVDENSWQRKYQEKTYGPLSQFGYKDFIPMFKAEKFNAEEWADLFQKAGAQFAGPVAEHHDGFAMWNTKWSEWNAAKMGPKRDVVGELEKAIKGHGMKFVTAFHHAANWFFFPTWDKRYDTSDPKYSGLYGVIHEQGAEPNKEFLEEWYGKLVEVVDNYDPDFVWFDFALDIIREDYVKDFVSYYYNKAVERNKEVIISYKGHDIPPGVALRDLELGQERNLTYQDWITDTSVDNQGAWGFVTIAGFKTADNLVDNLIDRVSKNGYLLLNVGPKSDGTIPEEAKNLLLEMGKWLKINGEAIYGTRAWTKYGEGPTNVKALEDEIGFNEADIKYTGKDIRFTVKADTLYAIALDWPGEEITIQSVVPYENEEEDLEYPGYYLYQNEIKSIIMLGDGQGLTWNLVPFKGLTIKTPENKPCDYAYVFKIVRKHGGTF